MNFFNKKHWYAKETTLVATFGSQPIKTIGWPSIIGILLEKSVLFRQLFWGIPRANRCFHGYNVCFFLTSLLEAGMHNTSLVIFPLFPYWYAKNTIIKFCLGANWKDRHFFEQCLILLLHLPPNPPQSLQFDLWIEFPHIASRIISASRGVTIRARNWVWMPTLHAISHNRGVCCKKK